MRFVNCATNLDEQNMTAFQYKEAIYFVTNTIVEPNTELLVWYGDDYATTLGLLPPKPSTKARNFSITVSMKFYTAFVFSLKKNWELSTVSSTKSNRRSALIHMFCLYATFLKFKAVGKHQESGAREGAPIRPTNLTEKVT